MIPFPNQCKGKRRYGNVETAKWMATELFKKGRSLTAYLCCVCGTWHLGHNPGQLDVKRGKGYVHRRLKVGRKLA